jgi:hypothetical protein
MIRVFVALLIALVAGPVAAFQPRTGHWNNPNESGTGMNIDAQDGTYVVMTYSYTAAGPAQWYISSGQSTNNGRTFTGSLEKYRNGQCISCAFVNPTPNGVDGTITINFTSEISATVTYPGGRVSNIQPFAFHTGNPPDGLLGQWIFVYDIISTFAERFDFTTILPPTSGGNGIATDPGRIAGCELQVIGAAAGTVVCADADSTGALENGYAFVFGLDETFSGNWISPFSGNLYPMKGFKIKSKSGYTRSADSVGGARADDALASRKAQEEGDAANLTTAQADALRAAVSEIGSALKSYAVKP